MMSRPAAPLFSGWNWVALISPFWMDEMKLPPYSVVASTQSLFSGEGVARYECTKYTRLSPTLLSSLESRLHGQKALRALHVS